MIAFDAEQQKLARQFDEKRARFVEAALPEVMRGLDEQLSLSLARRGPGARTAAIRQALAVTKTVVSAWRDHAPSPSASLPRLPWFSMALAVIALGPWLQLWY